MEGSNNQGITINVIRTGNLNVTSTAHYRTAEVSFNDITKNATENKDYGKSEGDVVFDVGEVRKCRSLHQMHCILLIKPNQTNCKHC